MQQRCMVYYGLAELSYETKITQPHLFIIRHPDKISMMYICKKFNSICAKTMFIHIINKLKVIYRIRQNFLVGKLSQLHYSFTLCLA